MNSTPMDYRRMLEDGLTEVGGFGGERQPTRLEFLSDHIFEFTTYDSEIAEEFARKALEVCRAINERRTYEYIRDPASYRWFLLMCNMPFFSERLSWGASVRGAWWDTPPHKKVIEFGSCGLFLGGEQITDLTLTVDQWHEFIAAVLAFGAEPA